MSLVKRVIETFLSKGIKSVYCTSHDDDSILPLDSNGLFYFVNDVRSAVFEAYGLAKISKNHTVVLVDDSYLANTYTALTEAWFQRVPIIIVSYNSRDKESSAYLERCVDETYIVDAESNCIDVVDKVLLTKGPSLIKVTEQVTRKSEIDYTTILNLLQKTHNLPEVFLYNSNISKEGFRNIDAKYKYGIISKYVGYLSSGKDAIICIPENILALDSNVFGIRNFPSHFKLIVKGEHSSLWEKLKVWISKNGIKTIETSVEVPTTTFEDYVNDCPVAIFVK